MSQQQSNAVSSNQNSSQPIAHEKNVQFRVMRLYKPSLYMIPNLPALTSSNNQLDPFSNGQLNADFAISPYILLPDSFGDIYLGETFTAYVAIVTGIQDIPLYSVNLSVRLQTANVTIDLSDIRPKENILSGTANVLQPNESVDIIISHVLTELGNHTLRATVQFQVLKTSEITTVRKFYRFNVLQPLNIVTNYYELNHKLYVQCNITNIAKSPLYLDQVNYTSSITDVIITSIKSKDIHMTLLESSYPYDLQLLNPNESHAYAFILQLPKELSHPLRVIGCPEVRWCTTLGESGIVRGSDTVYNNTGVTTTSLSNLSDSSNKQIRIICISSPKEVKLSEIFNVVIRIYNHSKSSLSLQIKMKSNINTSISNIQTITSTDFDNNLHLCGKSTINIGVVLAGAYNDVTLSVYSLQFGLQEMRDIIAVDIVTGKEYFSGSLFKVMVN